MIVTCPYCEGSGIYPEVGITCAVCGGDGEIDTAGSEVMQLAVDVRDRLVFTVMEDLATKADTLEIKIDDVMNKCNDIFDKVEELE